MPYVSVLETLTGTFLRYNRKVVVDGVRPKIPNHIPYCLQELMPKMWNKDSSVRPHFPEIEIAVKMAMEDVNLDSGVDVNQKFVPKKK